MGIEVQKLALWLGCKDVARAIGVSRQQVWRLIRSGRLPARRVGGQYVVSRPNVDRLMDARAAVRRVTGHPMLRRERGSRE